MFGLNKLILLLTFLQIFLSEPVESPVIAILGNPYPYNSENITTSRVNSQYVSWLEQSFATVVVIQPWSTKEEVDEILERVNGVIWPGGDRDLRFSGEFEQTAINIINKIMQLHDDHNVDVPLWGTCQGFEMIAAILANSLEVLTNFDGWDMQNSITFNSTVAQPYQTKMFGNFTRKDLIILQNQNVNAHYHRLGISEDSFNNTTLSKFLKITSYAKDMKGKMFINTYEGVNYPIFGVQFHPEMVAFKRRKMKGIPRSIDAVMISQKFSGFFLSQTRMNWNKIDEEELKKYTYINSNVDNPVFENGSYYFTYTRSDKINSVGENKICEI